MNYIDYYMIEVRRPGGNWQQVGNEYVKRTVAVVRKRFLFWHWDSLVLHGQYERELHVATGHAMLAALHCWKVSGSEEVRIIEVSRRRLWFKWYTSLTVIWRNGQLCG